VTSYLEKSDGEDTGGRVVGDAELQLAPGLVGRPGTGEIVAVGAAEAGLRAGVRAAAGGAGQTPQDDHPLVAGDEGAATWQRGRQGTHRRRRRLVAAALREVASHCEQSASLNPPALTPKGLRTRGQL
jgi:hypothetical protein